MLRGIISKDSPILRRQRAGVLSTLPEFDGDADATVLQSYVTNNAPTNPTLTIFAYVQRSYLTLAGLAAIDPSLPLDPLMDLPGMCVYIDNSALNSAVSLYERGGDFGTAASSEFENVLVPLKLEVTAARYKGWTTGALALDRARVSVAIHDFRPCFLYQNVNGGHAAGNSYRVRCSGLVACRDNFLYLRNLALTTSVRLTVNGGAPVVYNVQSDGRISHYFAEAIFPARVRVELFRGLNATGVRYGSQVINAFGGDEWRGQASDIAPRVSGPALNRALPAQWTGSASRTSVSFGGVHETLNNSIGTFWCTGAVPAPGLPDYFAVDTKAVRTIGTVRAITHDPAASHAATGDVYTSDDGIAWTLRKQWTVADITGVTLTVIFDLPVNARHFKFVPTSVCVDPGDWWSFDEIYAYADIP